MSVTPFETNDLILLKQFYPPQICADYLQTLLEAVNWSNDYYIAFGRKIDIPRLQAWYADAGIRYNYSNDLLTTQVWIEPLLEIKQQIEQMTQHRFNSVLLTCYRNGKDSVSWHADNEAELGCQPCIASLSLGACRQLHYRHKRNNLSGSISLHNGDLLIMRPGFQHDWEHSVPAQPDIDIARINLTFRAVTAVSAPGLPDHDAPQGSSP